MKNFLLLINGAIIEFDDEDENVTTEDEYKPGECSELGNMPITVTYTNVLFAPHPGYTSYKVKEITIMPSQLVCSWIQ